MVLYFNPGLLESFGLAKGSRGRGVKGLSGKPKEKSINAVVILEAARHKVWVVGIKVKTRVYASLPWTP